MQQQGRAVPARPGWPCQESDPCSVLSPCVLSIGLRVIVCIVGISEDRNRSASAPTLGIVPRACQPFASAVLRNILTLALAVGGL